MGTDIYGYIEAKLPWKENWKGACDLFWLYNNRDYDLFGCFFGVQNYARFDPIAAERGLPSDVSPELKHYLNEFENDYHGASWLSWSDIVQIDWEEKAEQVDKRIHEYQRIQQGELLYKGKALIESGFAERVGYDKCIGDQEQEWDLGDVVYRREKMRRKDVKDSWNHVFAMLESLSARYGPDHVRLVVWFA